MTLIEKGNKDPFSILHKGRRERLPNMKENIYVVYKGDSLICIGTRKECAEFMGVKTETLRGYNKPAYQRKLAKRKNARNYLTVEKLEDEEE